jgi:hypothetical protein
MSNGGAPSRGVKEAWWDDYLDGMFTRVMQPWHGIASWVSKLGTSTKYYSCGDFLIYYIPQKEELDSEHFGFGSWQSDIKFSSLFCNPIFHIIYRPDLEDYIELSFIYESGKRDIIFRLFDGVANPKMLPLCSGILRGRNIFYNCDVDKFISLYLQWVGL